MAELKDTFMSQEESSSMNESEESFIDYDCSPDGLCGFLLSAEEIAASKRNSIQEEMPSRKRKDYKKPSPEILRKERKTQHQRYGPYQVIPLTNWPTDCVDGLVNFN